MSSHSQPLYRHVRIARELLLRERFGCSWWVATPDGHTAGMERDLFNALLNCPTNLMMFQGYLARTKRFELLTPRFVVWCSPSDAVLVGPQAAALVLTMGNRSG